MGFSDYSLREAFGHRQLKDVRVFLREASFFLGTLKTEIRIRLYVRPEDQSRVHFEQSHQLQTPRSAARPGPVGGEADSEEEAFLEAVTQLTEAYDMAVMAGQRPQEEWLVPNRFF